MASFKLLNRGANVAQKLDLLDHPLVLRDMENDRGRMSPLGQDQGATTAPHMLVSSVESVFGRVATNVPMGGPLRGVS